MRPSRHWALIFLRLEPSLCLSLTFRSLNFCSFSFCSLKDGILVSWGQWAVGLHRSHLIIDSSTSQHCRTKQVSFNLGVPICQMVMRMAVRFKGDNGCKSDHYTALRLSQPESPWFWWAQRWCVRSSHLLEITNLLQSPHFPPWHTAMPSVGQLYCRHPSQAILIAECY